MDERNVKKSRQPRPPSFFWQGLLILLPVLVLAKVGSIAILQDKRFARHEAELRARELAELAADKLLGALNVSSLSDEQSVVVDFRGKLIEPKPVELHSANAEEAPFTNLSPAQSNLLHQAREAEFVSAN